MNRRDAEKKGIPEKVLDVAAGTFGLEGVSEVDSLSHPQVFFACPR